MTFRWLVVGVLFAWLPCRAADYPAVIEATTLVFPRDHGAHPAFRTEWWYVTGWLDRRDGAGQLGFQVTFFRVRTPAGADNPSRFAPRQILFAHAAVADPEIGRLVTAERGARTGFGLAEAREGQTDVWLGDWSLRQELPAYRAPYRARVRAEGFEMDLVLAPTQPVLLQGRQGFSQKAGNRKNASYYYSVPQLAVTGTVTLRGRRLGVGGSAWLDHEWSSELMPDEAVGWDWVGLNLADGAALMAFRMRDRSGNALWAGGTLRDSQGNARSFSPAEVEFLPQRKWRSPRTGAEYPVAMKLRVGDRTFDLKPLLDDQELDSRASTGAIYWEGAVRAYDGGTESGKGYLELTGYWKKLRF